MALGAYDTPIGVKDFSWSLLEVIEFRIGNTEPTVQPPSMRLTTSVLGLKSLGGVHVARVLTPT